MLKEFTGIGKSVEAAVDAAIETACLNLGCSREDHEWDIKIIDMPRKSFLGLKTHPAKASVSVELPDEKPVRPQQRPAQPPRQQDSPKPQQAQRPAFAKKPEQPQKAGRAAPKHENVQKPAREQIDRTVSAEKPKPLSIGEMSEKERLAADYIADVLKAAGLSAECTVTHEHGGTCVNIVGEGLGMIIGRRGETLDALQYLAGLVANRGEGDYMRLTVDCGDYRLKRKDTLEALAKKLAGQVIKTNISKTLEPMNPFERRIIHATVSEIEGVVSSSIGEEPNRRVVITSPTAKPPASKGGYRERSGFGRGQDNRNSRPHGGRPQPPRAVAKEYSDIKTVSPEYSPESEEHEVRAPREERPFNRERRDDRRDDRRGGGRERRGGERQGGGRRQAAPVPSGPPKKTPEAEKTAGLSFGKIELE